MRTTSCTVMILSDGQRMDMETLIEIYFIENFIKIVEERPSTSYNFHGSIKELYVFSSQTLRCTNVQTVSFYCFNFFGLECSLLIKEQSNRCTTARNSISIHSKTAYFYLNRNESRNLVEKPLKDFQANRNLWVCDKKVRRCR
jgi:hypothetical protein